MASGGKQRTRKKTPGRAAKGAGGAAKDTTPASEVVIEAEAEDILEGKRSQGAKNPFPSNSRDSDGSRKPSRKPGSAWFTDLPRIRPPGHWIAAGIAVAATLAALYGLFEARLLGQDHATLAQRVGVVEAQLSGIRDLDPAKAVAPLAARIDTLERSLPEIGAEQEASLERRLSEFESRLEEGLAEVAEEVASRAGGRGPEAPAADAELLARLERLESALSEIRDRAAAPEPAQTRTDRPGESEAGDSGEASTFWGFFGRLMKITRIEEE